MTTTLVIGNPKLASRTRDAAERLALALTGRPADTTVEVAELVPGVLGWGDPDVAAAVATVKQSSLVIVASPTFKATYTALLKAFLEQFEGGTGLRDVVAVALMLGGSPAHSLAPEFTLKPLLGELGAITATPGLYLLDGSYTDDGTLEAYAQRWAPVVAKLIG